MKMKSRMAAFGMIGGLAVAVVQNAQAVVSTWTGGAGAGTSSYTNAANWGGSVTFGDGNALYFSNPTANNFVVQVSGTRTIGALVFGSETSGAGAISVIGNNNTLAVNGVLGSTLGLAGDLANANVGLWVQPGAGANGLYANNVGGGNVPTKSQVGVPIFITNPATTFVNESGSDFYLNARLRGTTGGSLILQKGSWVIDYTELEGNNGRSQLNGGLTIEDATLTVNVFGGTTGGNGASPLGEGTLNLGLAGSSKDATFVFTSIQRSGTAASNRLTASSGNLVNIADGTGRRVIQNGSAAKKELYSSLTISGSATLTLDNAGINGAVFEISADNTGISADNDLKTGVRGTGNLYLTGGGVFYTKAFLSSNSGTAAANGARNSFTGVTTIHQGTLQFRDEGGFQASSRIQVDKNGVLDVTAATGGTYTLGNYSFSGSNYAQTLAGTGQVLGTLVLGEYSTLRPGGTDSATYRAALSFDSALAFGPLTIIDFSAGYHGAVDTAGLLSYSGELRLTLAQGFTAGGSYDLFDFQLQEGNFSSVTVYEGTTLVGSFAQGTGPAAGYWYGTLSGQDYQLELSSGVLSAVPEPGAATLLALAAALILRKRRRSHSASRG